MVKDDLSAFLADVADRAKPSTLRFYRARTKWVELAFGDRELQSLTAKEILAALDAANRWPNQKKKAPDTIRANTISWEQFQKWALESGRIENAITKPIKKPTGRQRNAIPTKEQIEAILTITPSAWGRIYQALLLTGARPDELCRATIADYDRAAQCILLQEHKTAGKTGRARAIPLNTGAAALVADAIGNRTEGPIFLSDRGKAWSREAVSRGFRTARDKLELDRGLVLYCTRHKAATELCHAAGIEAAAAVLGHAGLQTIRRYVHHDTTQLVKYAQAAAEQLMVKPPPADSAIADDSSPGLPG